MREIYNYGELKKKYKIDRALSEYKSNIPNANEKQIEFAKNIIERVFNFKDDGVIDVNYNRCGLGKSTLIKCILHNLVNVFDAHIFEGGTDILTVDNFGAIVVTDKLDRLEDIQSYRNLKDRCYFMKYDKQDEYVIYKNSKIEFEEQLSLQFKYPIVLLSTQKYFKMTKEERSMLYKWSGGERKIKFIDEKPYIIQPHVIDERYLTDINVALEKLHKNEDKEFLIDYWKKVYQKFDNLRDVYTAYDCNWISGNGKSELLNIATDKKFFNILEENVSKKVYDDITKLKDISKNGCLFIASNDKYSDNTRQFILIENNTDKFDTDKCKNIIFDATAYFDNHYTISEKYELFKENDDKDTDINIHNIQVGTSQNSLKTKENLIGTISAYINTNLDSNILVATHGKKSGIYQQFARKLDTNELIYFGDIKGKNDWQDKDTMVHVGFNRKSNYVYLATYIALTECYKNWNKIYNADEIYDDIQNIINAEKGLFVNAKMHEIMRSDLIVDTIQNLMRIRCRHFSNTNFCQIYLICSKMYEEVVDRIGYCVNAKVIKYTPPIFDEMKTMDRKPIEGKEKTNPQILLEYFNSIEKGTVLKMKDIMKGSKLTRDQVKECKKSNINCRKWFSENKVDGKNQYVA